ncbi:MAG TPA: DUF5640 domain-containing protein [Polyangia bacterium]|nr:DUF5640 domain-containing protein [Polyangia bacterium]
MKIQTALALVLSLFFLSLPAAARADAKADAKALVGKWTKTDNPKINWVFGAKGEFESHNSVLDNKGTFKLEGNKLNTHLTDLPERHYTLVSVDAHKLVLKDEEHSLTLEFTK